MSYPICTHCRQRIDEGLAFEHPCPHCGKPIGLKQPVTMTPNTIMTTDQALTVLGDLEALYSSRTMDEYERSIFVNARPALSVLTQEIERLTDRAGELGNALRRCVEWYDEDESESTREVFESARRACDWRQA